MATLPLRSAIEDTSAVEYVDPTRINAVSALDGPTIQRMCEEMNGAVIGGDWDVTGGLPFTERASFEAVRDHFVAGVPWPETAWFRQVAAALEAGQRKWGCSTLEELEGRCDDINGLFEAIRRDGYKTQQELGPRRPRSSEVEVGIGRDGRYIFLDGRHRLAIARILGLESIPVRVVARHAEWQAFRDELREWAAEQGSGRLYQRIDHPDLADIPADHSDDRLPIVLRALEGYDARGKRLVDLGTHMGFWCQQMSRLGFICTGVEANRRCVGFAGRIATATDTNFEVWRGDILDFPDMEQQDVVLALNILHHMLKTEERHARLIGLLGRVRAEMMLFETHVSDPPAQMRDAYRNYGTDEFVDFVLRHTGLRHAEFLGKAHDGRSLFRLTR